MAMFLAHLSYDYRDHDKRVGVGGKVAMRVVDHVPASSRSETIETAQN